MTCRAAKDLGTLRANRHGGQTVFFFVIIPKDPRGPATGFLHWYDLRGFRKPISWGKLVIEILLSTYCHLHGGFIDDTKSLFLFADIYV